MILAPPEQIKEYTEKGYWGTETIIDTFYSHAKAKPDKETLVDPYNKKDLVGTNPKRMTYSQVVKAVDRVALKFLELGVKKDDIILVQLPNISELVIAMFAAAKAGAIVSPIPVQWRTHEISQALSLLEPVVYVTSVNFHGFSYVNLAKELASKFKSVQHIITVGEEEVDGVLNFENILRDPIEERYPPDQLEGKQSGPNEVFTICWTSGTEADPKAVPRSHNHWLSISKAAVESFLPDEECVYLSLFPTINMAGLGAVLVPWVITGGKIVLHHPFDLGVFLKQLVEEKIYYTLAPPALLVPLAKSPQWAEMDKGNLTVIGTGSAAIPPWVVKKFEEDFGISIVNFFASNEGVGLYSCSRDIPDPEDRAKYYPRFGVEGLKWGSSKIIEGFKTRLVDPVTEEEINERGKIGELRFAGPTVFSGYYKQPELTAKAFDSKGYYRSGDLFSIEGENMEFYLFHTRLKDLIIRGGMNISPTEIESLVVEHPKVLDAAVIGYPDERLGERICVVVVPKQGEQVTLEEINEFLRQKDIAKYKYPEILKIVDALPRNPLGKVLKSEIREMVLKEAKKKSSS
ncbi:MAG: class I adenylate-forming enzyme family protein [Candidatus Freyarchaeota archaeon]